MTENKKPIQRMSDLTKKLWGIPLQKTASYRRFVNSGHIHEVEVPARFANVDEFFRLLRPQIL
jgi:hypothetical protein